MALPVTKKLFFTTILLISLQEIGRSANTPSDTIKNDTAKTTVSSDNGLKSKVHYQANDSIVSDITQKKMFLYGNAFVEYEDVELEAGFIEIDYAENVVRAAGVLDSSGKKTINKPVLKQGEESYDADSMAYNFVTKKAWIKKINTQSGDAFIHANVAKKDSNDVYYIKNGKYTTCDLEHPHYYIGMTKLKVIPDDKIVTGPAWLVIADIPTPLAIPFGFFPNKKGRASGVLLPEYGESANLGFFLKNGGYYFGISDYFDLALTGDIYSKGSFGVKTAANYVKRYKYDGDLDIGYSRFKEGEREFPDFALREDFSVRWTHTQDPKRNPSMRFSSNVNVVTSDYNKLNTYNPNDYLSNTFQSNVSWSKSWKRSNFSTNLRHSQNTLQRTVDLSLPEMAYSLNRLYPATWFTKKDGVVKNKWYDKIGISYSANAKNTISTYDSLLFKENSLDKLRYGVKHSVPVSTSINAKYFNITPSVSGNSYMYLQTINKRYDTANDSLITDTIQGFKEAHDFSASVNVSTRLYGMYQYRRGKVKAIRHVLNPTVGISYRPDYSESKYNYFQSVQTDSSGTIQQYNIFQNGIYGSPSGGKSGLLNFGLNNTLEAKLKPSKKDTSGTDRKVMLIEAFSISSAYNLAVDSFNWSPISLGGRTTLFKKLTINASASLDPYKLDYGTGKRIKDRYEIENNRLGRLTSANVSVGTTLRSKQKKEEKKTTRASEDELEYIRTHPEYYVDFDVPWTLNVSYNLLYSKPIATETITQTLRFSGDVNVTKKWKIGFDSGYDFIKKDISYTSLNIYRDLHCWEMKVNWVPFGQQKRYSIDINVKSPTLSDLKLSRKRDWYDYN